MMDFSKFTYNIKILNKSVAQVYNQFLTKLLVLLLFYVSFIFHLKTYDFLNQT